MASYLDKTGLAYFWRKILNLLNLKVDKVQEINHGTSDTTFTLTPNTMHIWGEVANLNLSLPSDTNNLLDEFIFTFTCPSSGATTLTLPATIGWVQEPELEAGKTYQVSIVNGLAGYLTEGMNSNAGISSISVNGTAQTITNNGVNIQLKTVNGTSLLGEGNISATGEGGGDTNVIEVVKVNNTALVPDANKAVNVEVPTKTSDLTNDSNFLTSFTETDPTVPSWAKAANKPSYTASEVGALPDTYTAPVTSVNGQTGAVSLTIPSAVTESTVTGWGFTKNTGTITGITMNGVSKGTSGVVDLGTVLTSHQDISGKANDSLVVHKTGNETITGNKTLNNASLTINYETGGEDPVTGEIEEVVNESIYVGNGYILHESLEPDFSWIKARSNEEEEEGSDPVGATTLQSVLDSKSTVTFRVW